MNERKKIQSSTKVFDNLYHCVTEQEVNGKSISISVDKRKMRYSVVVFSLNGNILKDLGEGWQLHNLPNVLTKAYKFCGFSYNKFIKEIKENNKE